MVRTITARALVELGLSTGHAAFLVENFEMCLFRSRHASPCSAEVRLDQAADSPIQIHWTEPTERALRNSGLATETIKNGAEALGLYTVWRTHGLYVSSSSRGDNGFDYILNRPGTEFSWFEGTRLELSGVLRDQTGREVRKRHAQKLSRLQKYGPVDDAIVAVSEFSTPKIDIRTY